MMQRQVIVGSLCSVLAAATLCWAGGKGLPGDAEAAKHGADASKVNLIEETLESDYLFQQYDLAVLSHYSYLIGSQGEALVVDPARDVDVYIAAAKEKGFKITGIYLTHSHADFVAGHMELAKRTGAPIYVNKLSGVGYPHVPVEDMTEIRIGGVKGVVRQTPGHTPDGTCLFIHRPAEARDPELCLTGDTLFIGSVGRPDLMGGAYSAAELATMIYNTWNNILSKVPDATKIYPAHGAGSLCGANLSDANVSTFGEQKQTNPYTRHKDVSTFVMAVLDGLPSAPQYFAKNAAMNKAGPPYVNWDQKIPSALSPSDVEKAGREGAWLLDVREAADFAAGHVPNAINIPIRGRFETWTGIMFPWGKPFILLGSDEQVAEAAFRLHRIGYDEPAGYLTGGIAAWKEAGQPVRTVTLVDPAELKKQLDGSQAPIIVDVRLPKEWMALRITEQLLNMPINELDVHAEKLNPEMPVLTVCNSAYRSSMGASVLLKKGFKDVRNLNGGGEAWIKAGLPTFSAKTTTGSKAPPAVFLDIPQRIAAKTLAQTLADVPGSIEVVDIRPAESYTEFHVAGSANASPAEAMNNPGYLVGRHPLVLICRDGSLSAAIGGTLTPKTERTIYYLTGGMQAYWEEVMTPPGVVTEKMIKNPGPSVPIPSVAQPPVAPPATPAKIKRPSAGC